MRTTTRFGKHTLSPPSASPAPPKPLHPARLTRIHCPMPLEGPSNSRRSQMRPHTGKHSTPPLDTRMGWQGRRRNRAGGDLIGAHGSSSFLLRYFHYSFRFMKAGALSLPRIGCLLFLFSPCAQADEWGYFGARKDYIPEEIAMPMHKNLKGIGAGGRYTVVLRQDGGLTQ